ncbi:alpha/beta hydrolase family protein [Chelativorans sp. YIM 93263]|uniref:alpha/beta hydrolase family protein n=1 Tax=Chelativorans sp. YIM 93263 TaxID=2906648 RepID=UPI0023788868|nr:alpha/beta fold hydrolase [Chelativorans sp. YIM 93263]
MAKVERTATKVLGFSSGEMDFQLMRMLGVCTAGGGAPGEIMDARAKIEGDDATQWPPAFANTAAMLVEKADEALVNGHKVTAREHLLRASSYFRSAEYFSDPFGSEVGAHGKASEDAFVKAIEQLPERVVPVQIPFEGKNLPGYLMHPQDAPNRNKTVIVLSGFDGTGEELYFQTGFDALKRGYTVLAAQGPGQVSTLRHHPDLLFRPDYETSIAAMIDFALGREEIDPERLALYGISFGGYFALRGASHDSRIKAVIANSPIIDLGAYMGAFAEGVGDDPEQAAEDVRLDEVDEVPDQYMPPAVKLSFKSACRRYGVQSFSEWLKALQDYRVDNLGEIRCPALAMVGEAEGGEAIRQFDEFAKSASGPVTSRRFTQAEGADMHCQLGNLPLSNAVIYDWLDGLSA